MPGWCCSPEGTQQASIVKRIRRLDPELSSAAGAKLTGTGSPALTLQSLSSAFHWPASVSEKCGLPRASLSIDSRVQKRRLGAESRALNHSTVTLQLLSHMSERVQHRTGDMTRGHKFLNLNFLKYS